MLNVTGLLLWSLAAAGQMQHGTPEFEASYREYRAAVEAYRRCDEVRALRYLRDLAPDDLRRLAAAVPDPDDTARQGGRVPWNSETLAAAYLFHLRAAAEHEAEGRDSSASHRDLAAGHLERLLASHPPGELDALSHLLWLGHLQHAGSLGGLLHALQRLPAPFRGRPLFLLAVGSLHEWLSTPLASLGPLVFPISRFEKAQPLDAWGKDFARVARGSRRDNRDAAIARYREAVSAGPSDAEPHLRLTFILIEDGRLTEARSALDAAPTREQPPVLRYYSALIRARLAERQSKHQEAAAAYEDATATAPHAQTPIIARARILLLQGQATEARRYLQAHLPQTSGDPDADPWWRYLFGQAWRVPVYVDRLDKMVRTCGH